MSRRTRSPAAAGRCRDGPIVLALAVFGCLSQTACGGGDGGDPFIPPIGRDVASIEVLSPIDTMMAVGWIGQLTARARDSDGDLVGGQTFSWQSSNTAVASVSQTGLVEALSPGSVTFTASVSSVSGSLRMRAVAADLDAVAAALGDPFTDALVTHLSGATQPEVQGALTQCSNGLAGDNIVAVLECLVAVRAPAAGASDPTDIVLLAVLGVLADHSERLLGL